MIFVVPWGYETVHILLSFAYYLNGYVTSMQSILCFYDSSQVSMQWEYSTEIYGMPKCTIYTFPHKNLQK